MSYKIQHNGATVAGLTVLAASAVMAVSVVTATPLKLNPPSGVFQGRDSRGQAARISEIDLVA